MVPTAWFVGCSQLFTTERGDLVNQLNSSLIHKVCVWLRLPGFYKDHVEKCALVLPVCGSWQEQWYSHKYRMSVDMGQGARSYPSLHRWWLQGTEGLRSDNFVVCFLSEHKPSESKGNIISAMSPLTLESLVSMISGKWVLKECVCDRGVFSKSAWMFLTWGEFQGWPPVTVLLVLKSCPVWRLFNTNSNRW